MKNWDVKIFRGILTGYNEAFIINNATRDQLVAASPKNAEIIRPILLGKNVKKYKYSWDNLWIIFTRKGIDIEKYPIIKEYLQQFYNQLRPRNNGEETGRKPGPYKWFEIQDNVAYYKDFDKPKIVWGNLALRSQFTLVEEGYYINAPSAFISTSNLYLLAILNSRLADYYIKSLGVSRNGGYFEFKPMFVEKLPIPQINSEEQFEFIKIVEEINSNIKNQMDITHLEKKIDKMVIELYGLTEEEKEFIIKTE